MTNSVYFITPANDEMAETGIVLFIYFTEDKNDPSNINCSVVYSLIQSVLIHSMGNFLLNVHFELVIKSKILASGFLFTIKSKVLKHISKAQRFLTVINSM